MMTRNTGLILALDVTDEEKALAIAKSLKNYLDYIKVNYPIVLACGLEIVQKLSAIAPVICDFKVADIPNTNRLIVEEVFKKGAAGVIVHGFVGRDSVEACVEAAKGKDVYVVPEMSHPGGTEFTQPVSDQVVKIALETGVSGIIAPATRPERIAHFRSMVGELKILATGVGAQGGSARAAIKAGADYVIVGRKLYKSESPVEEAKRIVEEIRTARMG
jgi:orotidine-5'-phosphate decarboxylase